MKHKQAICKNQYCENSLNSSSEGSIEKQMFSTFYYCDFCDAYICEYCINKISIGNIRSLNYPEGIMEPFNNAENDESINICPYCNLPLHETAKEI